MAKHWVVCSRLLVSDSYQLDVRCFRDSTANWSEPKNRSLQGGPVDDICLQSQRCRPSVPLLHPVCPQHRWRWFRILREAPAVLLFVHILTRTVSSAQHTLCPRCRCWHWLCFYDCIKFALYLFNACSIGAAMFSVTLPPRRLLRGWWLAMANKLSATKWTLV